MVSPYLNRPIRTLDEVLQARGEAKGPMCEDSAPPRGDALARPLPAAPLPAAPAGHPADATAADRRAA